jgi:hypothetical protein
MLAYAIPVPVWVGNGSQVAGLLLNKYNRYPAHTRRVQLNEAT